MPAKGYWKTDREGDEPPRCTQIALKRDGNDARICPFLRRLSRSANDTMFGMIRVTGGFAETSYTLCKRTPRSSNVVC